MSKKKGPPPIVYIVGVLVLGFGGYQVYQMLTELTNTGDDSNTAMFRGNLQRTGEYPGGGPTELNELLWQFPTNALVFSSPTVSEGVAYFGSQDNHLYALDVETGQELWNFQTDDPVTSSPAVSEGVVYFGSHDGRLRAVR